MMWTTLLMNLLFAIMIMMTCNDYGLCISSEELDEIVINNEVNAVAGMRAALPCDVEPREDKEDRLYMVMWFKDHIGKPLFSVDVRGRSFKDAKTWKDQNIFGGRATFSANLSALLVENVNLEDEGTYRCRVDFKKSQTRNFAIKLNIIVPPHQVLLLDEAGKDIAGVIGPLEEGGDFTLFCEVRGGRPQPIVTWLVNGKQFLDYTILSNDGMTIVSKLTMTGANRSWLKNDVRCRANNTDLISPYERSSRIEMNLRPTSVVIANKPTMIRAGIPKVMICITQGSRPPAQITWYKNNHPFEGNIREFENDTMSVNRLKLIPSPDDNNVTLSCRATNVQLGYALEDSFLMNVVFKPVVNISLGSTLNMDDIKEGDDVYFECNIKSNPREYRINWYHDDSSSKKLINQTPRRQGNSVKPSRAGIYISTKSLVLQKVDRSHGGLYSCSATNEYGESSSPDLYLRIQFAPLCNQPSPILVGAQLDEQVRIRCSVKADPPDVNFTWSFNNSENTFEVSPHRYGSNFIVYRGGTASELRIQASSVRDYGSLVCLAKNIIGDQEKPCAFQIIPAVRPTPPRNCTSLKVPRRVEPLLAIHCLAGYDGGLQQYFTLQTTGQPSQLLVNTSTGYQDLAVWLNVSWSTLEDIPDGQKLVVTAHNSKGPSEPVVLYGVVFKDRKNDTGTDGAMTKVPVAVALIVLAVLLAVGVATTVWICKRRRPTTRDETTPSSKNAIIVQLDTQGRRKIFTCPETSDTGRPDILHSKTDNDPPRVVLESSGDSYLIREVNPEPTSSRPEDVVEVT